MNGQTPNFPIVGIGASAGGVEALQVLFRAMPNPALPMAFIVVTHVGASHDSALPEILRECTAMPVVPARDGEVVQPGHAYVLPNDALITLAGGRLVLRRQLPENQRERQPIDLFFASLAEDQGETAIGIVLSGSGSDGTLGLKAIKEGGGLTIAQGKDGTVPRYPSMPNSAVASGVVDLVLPSNQIPVRLAELAQHQNGLDLAAEEDRRAGSANQAATRQDEISAILRMRVGHDFGGYKAKTFFRRVQRRMQVRAVQDIDAYIALLRQDEDEAAMLFRDLLISVTGFFRDAAAFSALTDRVMPAIFKDRGADDTVRIWVPGCATGEEAYSLAILAREQLADRNDGPRIQIFATDIDEAALLVARGGRYPASMMASVSPERLARFFVTDGATYAVSRETRDLCVFSSHSVIRDAPFSRIDLVSCRNLLIYMGGQLQEQVIPLFHYALRPKGYLFLGVSETTTRHDDLFKPEDKAHRIFQRRDSLVPGLPIRIQPPVQGGRQSWPSMAPLSRPSTGGAAELHQMAHAFAAEHFAPPHLLVNAMGDIVYQTANLGKYLEPAAGIPSRQLLAMARRGLRMDLRSALRQAIDQRRPATRPSVEVEFNGLRQTVAITVSPLPPRDGNDPLFMVVFADVQPPVPRQDLPGPDASEAPRDQVIELLEQDLREARERLQSMAEEYETATEELKSANEEMVSVNEELQSINEELETSKEELQSVNEELRTTNLELSTKIEQLDLANTDLRNLFDSTQVATLFLDRHLVIRNFTPAVTGIFDLVDSDRGRPLSSFTSHIDGVDFGQEARRVLDGRVPVERRVIARGGDAHYLMRMLPYTTGEGTIDGVVVTFFDITQVVEGELLGTLVDELNHRVRNMLQVVSAVSTHTLRRAVSLKDFGVTFGGRIRALARAHELVSLGGWSDVPLADLIEKELQPYAVGPGRLVTRGPPVWLLPKAALSMGMILHEMATNAAKHGALSTEGGRVTIEWSKEGPGAAARLVLRWTETGGPKVTMLPERRGFGSELIERQLRHDLGGTFDVDFNEAGLQSRIELPLNVLAEHGSNQKELG
ncbi:chemotaxis protein CheB [Falsiroseomonas sp. E2-1-a20]|uniref:chemotaxis protein CheB n=1 Tax=Falsiroseomonas sp. E2-1-a20 TaxID=3239300 RepID=UPI003F30800E